MSGPDISVVKCRHDRIFAVLCRVCRRIWAWACRAPYWVLLLLFVLLQCADYAWLGWGARVDEALGDVLVAQRAQLRTASDQVVVIDIDQKSLEMMREEAGNWPWPRTIHGELVEKIALQHPKAIVFDLFFNESDTFRLDSDRYFFDVVAKTPNVYPATVLLDDHGVGNKLGQFPAALKIKALPGVNPDVLVPLLVPNILPPESWRGGLVNFIVDADGIGRHFILWRDVEGWRIPSMPARVAEDLGWRQPEQSMIRINWQHGRRHIAYADLFQDMEREHPRRPQNELTGKVVIIGTSAPGLLDFRPTPLSKAYPGIDALASAMDNLQHGDWLRTPARGGFFLVALLLTSLLWLGFQRGINTLYLGAALVLASAAIVATAWLGLGLNQFWWLGMAILWGWMYFWLAALLAWFVERARSARTAALFGRFLDARVVQDLIAQGDIDLEQRAESRELTVLFSDIRGFTTLSETQSPEYIVNLLNRYFTQQVEVIFRHGGTLDKFIGDAIMAFWGAPIHDADHAQHAVAAALEMANVLEEFRLEMLNQGIQFDIGIGVHTGRAVVGFVGSQARLDYTVIGDTVNLASRIEGLTKGVARILVSGSTRAQCGDTFAFVPHGDFTVKGRTEPVALYEPQVIVAKENAL